MSFLERAGTHNAILFMVGSAVLDQPYQLFAVASYFVGLEAYQLYRKSSLERKQKGRNRTQEVAMNVRSGIH